MVDVTRLRKLEITVDRAKVVDLGSGDLPRAITVQKPGPDGALVKAWWTGHPPALTVDDYVRLQRTNSDAIGWRVIDAAAGTPSLAISSRLVDAKGDLIVATGDNQVARLPAGTDGQILTADSGEAAGLKWRQLSLDDLADVDAASPGHNNIIIFNDASGYWELAGYPGVTDHGALAGLGDDDHPQYANQVRGDARYTLRTSAARPGVTKLYRRENDSDYSVQVHHDGTRWFLRGYNGDTFHAECRVGYADSAAAAAQAANATMAGVATQAGYANNADTVDGYHAQGLINLMNEIGEGIIIFRQSAVTPTQSTIYRIPLNEIYWNSLGGSLDTGTGIYYVPESGWYLIYGGVGWNSGANGNIRNSYIRCYGNHYMAVQGNSNSGINDYSSLSCVAYLTAGASVELLVWTNAPSAAIYPSNFYSPVLGLVRLTRPW